MSFQFKFPDIGEGIHEGKVLEIYVKVGQSVKEGEPLMKVETDKIVTDIPSPKTGTVGNILCKEGEIVFVDNVVFEIQTGDSPAESEPKASPQSTTDGADEPEEKGAGVVGQIEVASKGSAVMSAPKEHESASSHVASKNKKVLATPVARKLAHDLGVEIQTVQGTGPQGRVLKSDIQSAAGSRPTVSTGGASLADQPGTRESFSMIRQTIMERMTQALAIPHFAIHEELEVSELVKLRQTYVEQSGEKISYVAFFIKAVAQALKQFPNVNASIDAQKKEVIYHKNIHVGCAVDTDRGLMVPVVRHADQLSLKAIHNEIVRLSEEARNKTIKLSELKGSTFTVSSIGSIAGTQVHPVINPPEAGILGIGRIQKTPVVSEQGAIVPGQVLKLCMCADHRLIDGADAARFMSVLKRNLESPALLLIEG